MTLLFFWAEEVHELVKFLNKKKIGIHRRKISRPCERCPVLYFVILWNSRHVQLRNFLIDQKYCAKMVSQKFRKNVTNLITKLRWNKYRACRNSHTMLLFNPLVVFWWYIYLHLHFRNVCMNLIFYVLRPKM